MRILSKIFNNQSVGLEHSVANMFLIPLGILRGAGVSVSDFLLKNLLPVTLGNIGEPFPNTYMLIYIHS